MYNTPGVIIPSSFSSKKELEDELHRRDEEAGFIPFDVTEFLHSVMNNQIDVDVFLEHHGIKGMHWGIRNQSRPEGVSRGTNRAAAKDAKEFAAAKLFFGEGAGTRRKLIKNTVEAKKKHSSSYAKAFDMHLANQDLSKHASKAVSKRNRIDRSQRTKQRAGFLARKVTGEQGTQAAFVAAAVTGAAFLNSPKGRRLISNAGGKIKDFQNSSAQKRGAAHISKLLKNMQ